MHNTHTNLVVTKYTVKQSTKPFVCTVELQIKNAFVDRTVDTGYIYSEFGNINRNDGVCSYVT